eukprot:750094-Hanusia_phi.AAC.2
MATEDLTASLVLQGLRLAASHVRLPEDLPKPALKPNTAAQEASGSKNKLSSGKLRCSANFLAAS